MSIRGFERFAVGSLLLSLGLIAADRIRHPRGLFFWVPLPRHRAGVLRALWFIFRTRPALGVGVILLLLGLGAALIAACAQVSTVRTPRETDR